MADYRRVLLQQNRSAAQVTNNSDAANAANGSARASKKEQRRIAAAQRRSLTTLRAAARDAEAELARLSEEKAAMLEKLKNPDFYRDQPDEAQALQRAIGRLQKDLDAAETRWLTDQEALEAAMGGG
jgi:ATP-binding cassette subfamily F protein 3